MKVYKSSSFEMSFMGTRKDAIEAAIKYVTNLIGSGTVSIGNRFTWRADDDSGFTIQVYNTAIAAHYPANPAVKLMYKWNAARN